MKKYNIDQLYNLYVAEYDKAAKSVKRLTGRNMYVGKLTKKQFKARATAAENSGITVNSKYVKEFVDASKYEITRAQAKLRKEALEKKTGKKFTELSVRRHTRADVIKAWDEIAIERNNLMNKGLSSDAASKIIAINYFGSN